MSASHHKTVQCVARSLVLSRHHTLKKREGTSEYVGHTKVARLEVQNLCPRILDSETYAGLRGQVWMLGSLLLIEIERDVFIDRENT